MILLYVKIDGDLQLLDLDADLSLPLTLQVADFGDLTDRNYGYSQSITLPRTERNDRLLGWYGRHDTASAVGNGVFECHLVEDGYPIKAAEYIKILNATDTEISVQVVSGAAQFIDIIGGDSGRGDKLKLNDLSLDYHGTYDIALQENGDKVFLGLVNWAADNKTTSESVQDANGEISVQLNAQTWLIDAKSIFEEIITAAGYQLNADLDDAGQKIWNTAAIPLGKRQQVKSYYDPTGCNTEQIGTASMEVLRTSPLYTEYSIGFVKESREEEPTSIFPNPIVLSEDSCLNFNPYNDDPDSPNYYYLEMQVSEGKTDTRISYTISVTSDAITAGNRPTALLYLTDAHNQVAHIIFTDASGWVVVGDTATLDVTHIWTEYYSVQANMGTGVRLLSLYVDFDNKVEGVEQAVTISVTNFAMEVVGFVPLELITDNVFPSITIGGNLPDMAQKDYFLAFLRLLGAFAEVHGDVVYIKSYGKLVTATPKMLEEYDVETGEVHRYISGSARQNLIKFGKLSKPSGGAAGLSYVYEITEGEAVWYNEHGGIVYSGATFATSVVGYVAGSDYYYLVDYKGVQAREYQDAAAVASSGEPLANEATLVDVGADSVLGTSYHDIAHIKACDTSDYSWDDIPLMFVFRRDKLTTHVYHGTADYGTLDLPVYSACPKTPSDGDYSPFSMTEWMLEYNYRVLAEAIFSDPLEVEGAVFALTANAFNNLDLTSWVTIPATGQRYLVTKVDNYESGKTCKVNLLRVTGDWVEYS